MAAAASTAGVPQDTRRVVICGGGVIGVSLAYFLAQRGVAATIVERGTIACAASGKAGGFLALDWCDSGPVGPLARHSFALHQQLAQVLGEETVGYRRVNTLAIGASAAHIGTKAGRQKAGAPDWVDGNLLTLQVMGGPKTTAQVHPAKFTRAMLAAAENLGATVRHGTVEGIITTDSDGGPVVSGVTVDGELLPADVVVIAMGPWSGQAARWLPLPANISSGDPKYTSIVLRPAEAVGADMLFMEWRNRQGISKQPEVYPRPDGTVYVCGEPTDAHLPDDPLTVGPADAAVAGLRDAAAAVSSRLAAAPMEISQACYLPSSPDGAPVLGAVPGVSGAYIATGHSCWGILNAPATAAAMTELILDGKATCVDISKLSPARFGTRVRQRQRVF